MKCANVLNDGTADGTDIVQETCTSSTGQIFRFQDQGGGIYRILNPASGRCVSAAGGGAINYVIEIRTCSATDTLQQFNSVPDVTGYYKLVNLAAGNCVDIYLQSTANGGQYETYTCNGGSNQSFRYATP
jgi:hypothetical protein